MRANKHTEAGQGLVEYALILVLVAVAAIIAMSTMGGRIQATFEYILISTEYTSLDALIDHCMEGASNGEINSLKNHAENNPTAFENRVNELGDNETISSACRARMLELGL